MRLHRTVLLAPLLSLCCARGSLPDAPALRSPATETPAPSALPELSALPAGAPARVGAAASFDARARFVLLSGGLDARTGRPCEDAYLLEPATGVWRRLPGLPPRSQHASVWWRDRWWLLGGRGARGEALGVATVDLAGHYEERPAEGAEPRWAGAAVSAGEQGILWLGGLTEEGGEPLAEALWRGPEGERWQRATTLGAAASRSEAHLRWTGTRVLLWGGAHPWAMPDALGPAAWTPGEPRWERMEGEAPPPEVGRTEAFAAGRWALSTLGGVRLWSEPLRAWQGAEEGRAAYSARGALWVLEGRGAASRLRALEAGGATVPAAALDREDALVAEADGQTVVLWGSREGRPLDEGAWLR